MQDKRTDEPQEKLSRTKEVFLLIGKFFFLVLQNISKILRIRIREFKKTLKELWIIIITLKFNKEAYIMYDSIITI